MRGLDAGALVRGKSGVLCAGAVAGPVLRAGVPVVWCRLAAGDCRGVVTGGALPGDYLPGCLVTGVLSGGVLLPGYRVRAFVCRAVVPGVWCCCHVLHVGLRCWVVYPVLCWLSYNSFVPGPVGCVSGGPGLNKNTPDQIGRGFIFAWQKGHFFRGIS